LARLLVTANRLAATATTGAIHQAAFLAMRGAGLFKAFINGGFVHHIDLAEKRAKFLRDPLAILLVEIKDRDLDAKRAERRDGCLAKTGCAAGNDSRNRFIELHDRVSPSPCCLL